MQQNPKFPWEERDPIAGCGGFKQCVGTLTLYLGYAVYPEAVRLVAVQDFGGTTSPWRSLWVPRQEAVEAAMEMASDADDYLESFKHLPRRPVEDLDYYDFIEHLEMRLNNELH